MRNAIFTLMLLAGMASAAAARADEFTGSRPSNGQAIDDLNQQASQAEASDPTAASSVRSHGRP